MNSHDQGLHELAGRVLDSLVSTALLLLALLNLLMFTMLVRQVGIEQIEDLLVTRRCNLSGA
jgi:hypothetical protein